MAKTTAANVRAIAKHLKGLSDEELQLYIDDAYTEVVAVGVPETYQERANRYLAAHLVSLNIRRSVEDKLDVITKKYADEGGEGLSGTPYGQEYKRLLKVAGGARGLLNLTVI